MDTNGYRNNWLLMDTKQSEWIQMDKEQSERIQMYTEQSAVIGYLTIGKDINLYKLMILNLNEYK